MADENVILFPKKQPDEPVTTTDNVIPFPIKPKSRTPLPKDEAEIQERVNTIKSMHVEETAAVLTPYILDRMLASGFIVNNSEYLKDIALIVEAIKSIMYKHYGMVHPLQTLSEDLFIAKSGMVYWNHGNQQVTPGVDENTVILEETDLNEGDEELI